MIGKRVERTDPDHEHSAADLEAIQAEHPGGQDTGKLYLIEIEYVGANRASKDRHAHKLRVQDVPGRKNMSGETCIDGYLGTTDDWHKNAWGEFDSLVAVAAKITELWGVVPLDLVVGDEIYLAHTGE